MSNLYNYNPIPPRVWSRVQNNCTYVDSSDNNYYQSVIIPIPVIPSTQQPMTLAEANYQDKLIYKGNILQYKGNSAQLTKKQKYTQLAKGFGPGRTKVFATQTQTYTNPNTTGLVRVNSVEIPFPNTLVGQPNNISGPFQYAIPNPNGCATNSLQDGGSLVCGTYADPCSGAIIKAGATSATICNPASASNVPGSSVLCWNKNVQTWFPRQRYTMTNSGTKWPQGYKGLVSAVATRQVVSILSASSVPNDNTRVILNWSGGKIYCSNNWELYQNGVLLNSYDIDTATITGLVPGTTYTYYVICQNSCAIVAQSNTVTVKPINDIVQQTVHDSYTYVVQPGSLYYNNVTVIGGGGGGGGPFMGTENAQGKLGGSGGGGGGITHINTNVSITTQTTLTYIVGSGGSGGTLSSGTAGNTSSFTDVVASINLNAAGGGLGLYDDILFPYGNTFFISGGTGGAGSGGDINGTGGMGGNSGGVGSPTNNNTGFNPTSTPGGVSTTANGPGGGGGGGCIYRTPGSGGVYFFSNGASGGNGGAGAIGGIAGSISGPVIVGNGNGTIGFGGSGGGGVGGNSFSGSGTQTQTGGHGLYGSGGGGSGACHTSDKIGVGGNGGAGFVGFTVYRLLIS